MKRISSLLVVSMLLAVGCSRSPEAKLAGKWINPEVKGFSAEFKKDHTGLTASQAPGKDGAPAGPEIKVPFKWSLEKDRIKITEDANTVYYGKLVGKKLEIEVNGSKSTLEKK